jgi:hypothetical protein
VQDTGTFRWEANDPGCLVIQRQGPGNAILPFAHQGGGDSDAFETGGKITVEIADFLGNGECDLLLRDAANGQDLDFGTVTQGGDPLVLDSGGRSPVYLAGLQCDVRVSAA